MGAETDGRSGAGELERLSGELGAMARRLEGLARRELLWRGSGEVTAGLVEAVIAARHARSAAFGIDLLHPGWNLLLELFRAHLEVRAARLPRLAADAQVAQSTALRWINQLCEAGLVERSADPDRAGGLLFRLSAAGAAAMHDHLAEAGLAAG